MPRRPAQPRPREAHSPYSENRLGPSNLDLQRQIDQLRQDNHDEHEGMKKLLEPLAKLVEVHELRIEGKEGEGGLIRDVAHLRNENTQTRWGAAVGTIAILVTIIVAKIERFF